MSAFNKLYYLFLVTAVIVIFIGVFASITIVADITPMNSTMIGMIGYCIGLGTVFFFIYIRLRKGYRNSMIQMKKEHNDQQQKDKTSPEKPEEEAEY